MQTEAAYFCERNRKMKQRQWKSVWYTIPAFAHIRPQNPYHKEQDSVTMKVFGFHNGMAMRPAGQKAEPEGGLTMDMECPQNLHVQARAEFYARKGENLRYLLDLTADDYYKLYVNGAFAAQGPAPAYPEQYYYNTLDLTPWLREGKNVLAVHLYYQGLVNRVWNSGDGRFAMASRLQAVMQPGEGKGYKGYPGNDNFEGLQGETQPENDNFEGLQSETQPENDISLSWKYQICRAYSGAVTGYDTQFLENFDSRLWEDNWNGISYDDSRWEAMVPAEWADYCLIPQPTEMLAVYRKKPAAMIQTGGNRWLLDAGEETAGGVFLTARGRAGSKVILTYGEELEEAVPGAAEQVRWQMRCNCGYREEWTLGSGISRYVPYDYKGFRYAALEAEEPIEILDVQIENRHYSMRQEESFLKTGAPFLEEIFQICKRAVTIGTQEGYLDCPTREKGQYLGDAVVTARSQVWLTGKTDMLRKCVSQFAQTQEICPGLMGVAPGSLMQEIADFSLLWLQLLMTDYEFTGDQDFLRRYYPAAVKIIEYFSRYAREDGLLDCVSEKWNLVDWPENLRDGYEFPLTRPVVAKGCHNVINGLYVGAMKTLSEIEEILELPKTCSWEKQREAFHRVFYRPDQGLYADSETGNHCALHSNLYPLYFDFAPEKTKSSIVRFLLRKGIACGTMTSYYLLKALARAGYPQEMYRLMVNTGSHGWVNMLREGATACFEAWGKEQKWNTSLCHPWSSAPVSLLAEEIAGIHLAPERPGGYEFIPHISDEIEDFVLQVPFRGRILQVKKENGTVRCSDHLSAQ